MYFRVKSKYDRNSKTPYIRELIDQKTGEVIHHLAFDHEPGWDEFMAEVKRLEALDDTPKVSTCYVCGAEITPLTRHVIRFTDGSYNLCPHCYDTTQSFFAFMRQRMNKSKEESEW